MSAEGTHAKRLYLTSTAQLRLHSHSLSVVCVCGSWSMPAVSASGLVALSEPALMLYTPATVTRVRITNAYVYGNGVHSLFRADC